MCVYFYSLVGGLFYVRMVYTILVKIPMFVVHLWLPRAHVEGPWLVFC